MLQTQLRRTRLIAAPVFVALLTSTAPGLLGQASPWKDPSPHKVLRIMVAAGVELEVLDWGGTGEPLVFLAGFGNTAHIFD